MQDDGQELLELTELIGQAGAEQDSDAQAELMDRVYGRLRSIAARQLRGGKSETLRPTAMVNEAYMRLFGRGAQRFDGQGHFFAAAATVMRQIAVDRARRTRAAKRGGNWERTTLSNVAHAHEVDPGLMLELDEALNQLATMASRQARVVELRFFAGLTVEETAEALGVSARTIELDWRTARAFLRAQLGERAAL